MSLPIVDDVVDHDHDGADANVARVAAHLTAFGFALVPLLHAISGIWQLLAVSPRGLTLVAVTASKPNLLGATYGLPPGWPQTTVRLILHWPVSEPLPRAITL